MSLLCNDYPSPYYLTYLQCKERNGLINAGVKGELIVYWSIKDIPLNDDEFRRVPLIRYSYVFNLSQTNLFTDKTNAIKIVSCEHLISKLKIQPIIKHNISRCYYSPVEDYISLPMITDFDSAGEYYSSLFHELIHWSGHSSRLNRQLDTATEELVAEIGSSYLCGLCGIDNSVIDNQASYIQAWTKSADNPQLVFVKAAALASQAVNYIIVS